jgi:lipid-binding SYLF domain-containing protein
MIRSICALAVSFLALAAFTSCSTVPDTAQGRSHLENLSADALSKAKSADPTFDKFLANAYGCAVFPSVAKGGIGIGGAHGQGVLYEGDTIVGYCDLTQASIGAQLGGQTYTELLVFQNKEAIDKFKTGRFTFDAQATAVAIESGAAANAKFAHGVAAFTTDQSGLMYEASIGGQKFSYEPKSTFSSPTTMTGGM